MLITKPVTIIHLVESINNRSQSRFRQAISEFSPLQEEEMMTPLILLKITTVIYHKFQNPIVICVYSLIKEFNSLRVSSLTLETGRLRNESHDGLILSWLRYKASPLFDGSDY